jgi:hypothetical protein
MIYNVFVLFVSTFALCVLFGMQSQIVRLGHKSHAFLSSIGIGTLQLFSYKLLPSGGVYEMIAFVLGGACGIVASIEIHSYYVRWLGIKDNRGIEK